MSVTVTQGTQTIIQTALIGGTETQVIRLDQGSGTAASLYSGTIPQVTTISTLTAGTVDTIGLTHANKFGTVISSGTSVVGTIKAGIAGSQIFVTDMIISGSAATNVEIGDGGTANLIVGSLFLGANGGMVVDLRTPIFTTAGSALVYKQSANQPLTITCQGYVK